MDTNSFLYLDNAYSIYLNIEQNSSTTMPEFSNYANLPNVNYFINYKTGTIRNNDLQGTYQNIDYQPTVTTNFMFISDILADELICGDKSDIVITTKIAENLFNTKAYDQVLGKHVYVNSKNDEYSGIVSGVIVDEGQGVYLPNRVMSYFITTASTSVSGDFGTFVSLERFNYSVIGETVNSGKYVPCYVLEESDYKLGDLLNYDVMVVGYVKVENLPGVYDKNVIFTEKSYVIDYNNRRMIEDHNGVYVNDVVNYLIVEGQDLDSLSLDYCLAPIDSGYEIGEIYKPVGSKLSFEVCGLYTSNYVNSYNRMLINKKTAIMAYCDTSNLWFKTNNLLEINSLVEKPYYIQNVFEHEVEVIKNVNNADIMIYGVISIILFIVYSLFIYISMRSKIHREEHNIAVYRCLGASKGVFIKTHLIDVSILTLFLSIPGYCLTYLILYLTNLFSTTVANHMLVYLNVWSFLIGLLILFFLNFIIGVLPMIKLLSKKPAVLISKYDL